MADLVTDPIVDSVRYNFENTPGMTVSDTSEVPCDTVFIWGELIYFKVNSPWLKRIKYFGESFALVNALIITILISIFTMISLLIIILMNRRRMEREEKLHHFLMEKYQSLIVDFLYGTAAPRRIQGNCF